MKAYTYVQPLQIGCNYEFLSYEEQFENFKYGFEGLGETDQYSVNLSACSEKQVKEIFGLLFRKPKKNLVYLMLESTTLPSSEFSRFTSVECPHLQTINICILLNYSAGGHFNPQCSQLLSKCILPELENLQLPNCSIDDSSIKIICTGKWPKLKNVDFIKM